jgi:hypothetical protein
MENNVNSWKDMKVKYPEYRDEMTKETEREFVKDCFDLYEKDEISKIFWSPFSDYEEKIGSHFVIVRRCTEKDCDLCCLPMWKIKFEDNTVIDAYPEEIILREMIDNGYEM